MAEQILIDRAVVEQALEALGKTMNAWGGTCAWHGDVKQAITALRAALAQQTPQQAEPVHKPVAWAPKWAIARLTGKLGAVADPVTWGVDAPLFVRETADCEPLYTVPPQQQAEPGRKPLPAGVWVYVT